MKRKFDVKLRKVGNSFVVTIPMDTIERFDIKEGDFLAVSLDSKDIKKINEKEKNPKGDSK
jgi:putative addiction module antidote